MPSEIFRQPPNAHVSYVIGMVQLARLCMGCLSYKVIVANFRYPVREVVLSQYLPGRSKLENPSRPLLHQRLVDWESNLPKDMRFNPSMSRDVMFLIGMLHMAYKYGYLQLIRHKASDMTPVICLYFFIGRYSCNLPVYQPFQKGTWHWMPRRGAPGF